MTKHNATPKNKILLQDGKIIAASIVSQGKDLEDILKQIQETPEAIAEARDKIATAMSGLQLMAMNEVNKENRNTASQSSILLEEAMNCLINIV
jgi:hypothetical protein